MSNPDQVTNERPALQHKEPKLYFIAIDLNDCDPELMYHAVLHLGVDDNVAEDVTRTAMKSGRGMVGPFTHDVAETKVAAADRCPLVSTSTLGLTLEEQ